jgi:hypothetical protein
MNKLPQESDDEKRMAMFKDFKDFIEGSIKSGLTVGFLLKILSLRDLIFGADLDPVTLKLGGVIKEDLIQLGEKTILFLPEQFLNVFDIKLNELTLKNKTSQKEIREKKDVFSVIDDKSGTIKKVEKAEVTFRFFKKVIPEKWNLQLSNNFSEDYLTKEDAAILVCVCKM